MSNSSIPETELFQGICKHIQEHWDEVLHLERLSKMAALSSGHFQRRFKAIIGVSPRQYQEACRFDQLRQALREGKATTEALYEAGFASSSRVYEKLDTHLGMTPGQYQRGGKGLAISYASAPSSLGIMMLGATDRGLCFLQFGQKAEQLLLGLQQEFPAAILSPMDERMNATFMQWMNILEAHLQGEKPHLNLPLDPQGTAFQLKVWRALQQIPYGKVQSYTEVAVGIGQPKAARAVASACAANKLAVIIPCHRVIRGSGELGGYRWGLPVKRALLARENQSASDFS